MGNETISSPSLEQVLLCDDVRREVNGKQIIIGVYGDDILLPLFPISIPLCLWMRFRFRSPGTHSLEFSVIGERQQRLIPPTTVKVTVPDPPKAIDITLGGILLNITEPEALRFQWRDEAGEWKQMLAAKVVQGSVAQPIPGETTVSPPLS